MASYQYSAAIVQLHNEYLEQINKHNIQGFDPIKGEINSIDPIILDQYMYSFSFRYFYLFPLPNLLDHSEVLISLKRLSYGYRLDRNAERMRNERG